MRQKHISDAIIASRYRFRKAERLVMQSGAEAEEGGCGVTGFACSIPVSGRHIFEPSAQMHNRGNGKGGGLAAVGLSAAKLGVDQVAGSVGYDSVAAFNRAFKKHLGLPPASWRTQQRAAAGNAVAG